MTKKHKLGDLLPKFDDTFYSGESSDKSEIMKIFLLQSDQLSDIQKALERNTEAVYQLYDIIRRKNEK